MAIFTAKEKIFISRLYLEGKHSYLELQDLFKVSYQMIQGWVYLYQIQGEEGFKKSYTRYSAEFKMDVLNYMNDTGTSSYEAAAIFNISSPALVRTWRLNFIAGGFDALISKKKGQISMKKETKKGKLVEGSTEALEERIKQLEMENSYLKKLNALVQMQEKLHPKSKRK